MLVYFNSKATKRPLDLLKLVRKLVDAVKHLFNGLGLLKLFVDSLQNLAQLLGFVGAEPRPGLTQPALQQAEHVLCNPQELSKFLHVGVAVVKLAL